MTKNKGRRLRELELSSDDTPWIVPAIYFIHVYQKRFRGIAGSAITKVFDLFIGKTGLTSEGIRNGFDPVEEVIESITRAGYYPGNKPIWIKIVADRKSGRVLGSHLLVVRE